MLKKVRNGWKKGGFTVSNENMDGEVAKYGIDAEYEAEVSSEIQPPPSGMSIDWFQQWIDIDTDVQVVRSGYSEVTSFRATAGAPAKDPCSVTSSSR